MDRIALSANPNRLPGGDFLPALLRALESHGLEVRVEDAVACRAGCSGGGDLRHLASWADMVIVVGGDGSMLRAVHSMMPVVRPIMGVNSGRLGFLTYSTASDPNEIAAAVRDHSFDLSERTLLEGVVVRSGHETGRVVAVNEITVTRRNVARMIHVEASVHGELLNEYHADGVIVATPTGSTAYSMSAGGPIVEPGSGVMVLTPICPHALSNRSVVVWDTEPVELRVHSHDERDPVMFTADGETACLLEPGDVLRLQRAAACLPLALPADRSFFETLRLKLRWHGANVFPGDAE